MSKKAVGLTIGFALLATLMLFGASSKSAQAQAPDPQGPGTVVIEKTCVGDDGSIIEGGTAFTIDVTFTLNPDPVTVEATEFDASDFDFSFEIDCGETLVASVFDGTEPEDLGVQELFAFLELAYEGPVTSMFFTLSEVASPGVTAAFGADCANPVEIYDESNGGGLGDPDPLQDQLESTGLVCTILNTFDLPSLIITKSCPTGDGDGDSDFNILVTGGDLPFADSLDCGGETEMEDQAPGVYIVSELITSPDAANFTTSIVCDGVKTAFPTAFATLAFGADTECTITNVFAETPAPPSPTVPTGGIDLDNTNTNALNNTNRNDNNNQNTNTQQQSNRQTQVNDNNQTTTVNSSPSVNISGVPRTAVSPAAPPPAPSTAPTVLRAPSTGESGFIAPPRTGDAGLAGTSNGLGLATAGLIMGGLVATGVMATLKFGRSRGQ